MGPMGHSRSKLFKGLPKKGTKRRELLRCLLRPQGLTAYEAISTDMINDTQNFTGAIDYLRNEKGWDIRGFPCSDDLRINPDKKKTKDSLIYKIVGRVRPNRYRQLSKHSID